MPGNGLERFSARNREALLFGAVDDALGNRVLGIALDGGG
jgi:hypothetical protein